MWLPYLQFLFTQFSRGVIIGVCSATIVQQISRIFHDTEIYYRRNIELPKLNLFQESHDPCCCAIREPPAILICEDVMETIKKEIKKEEDNKQDETSKHVHCKDN